MAIKLLSNVIHEGILFRAGQIVEGIADSVCEAIVARGLAEQTDEEATTKYTDKGVEPQSVVNPAAEHSAPVDQSSTQAVAGQPVVPAATAAPAAATADGTDQAAAVTPAATAAPVAPVAPQAPAAPANAANPTPEEIQKAIEGIQ